MVAGGSHRAGAGGLRVDQSAAVVAELSAFHAIQLVVFAVGLHAVAIVAEQLELQFQLQFKQGHAFQSVCVRRTQWQPIYPESFRS